MSLRAPASCPAQVYCSTPGTMAFEPGSPSTGKPYTGTSITLSFTFKPAMAAPPPAPACTPAAPR